VGRQAAGLSFNDNSTRACILLPVVALALVAWGGWRSRTREKRPAQEAGRTMRRAPRDRSTGNGSTPCQDEG
jgi:hypothetical protein